MVSRGSRSGLQSIATVGQGTGRLRSSDQGCRTGGAIPLLPLPSAMLFAAQGQWKPAAEDLQQVYQKLADFRDGACRAPNMGIGEAALIYAIAGDLENYERAVAECYRKQAPERPTRMRAS